MPGGLSCISSYRRQAALLGRGHGVACGHPAQAGCARGCQLGERLGINADAAFHGAVKAIQRQHVGAAVHRLDARDGAFLGGHIKAQHVAVEMPVLGVPIVVSDAGNVMVAVDGTRVSLSI